MLTLRPQIDRRRLLVASLLIGGGILTGCSTSSRSNAPAPTSAASDADSLLASHDLRGLDAAGVIGRLDAMPVAKRPADLMASIRPTTLLLEDEHGRTAQLPMPADSVYVSVAPYREQTHECHFHSLTTCRGELRNAEVQVTLARSDGTVLINEVRRTFDNGFLGLWIPRGIRANLTVAHEGRTGTARISTAGPEDATCVTTLQLA